LEDIFHSLASNLNVSAWSIRARDSDKMNEQEDLVYNIADASFDISGNVCLEGVESDTINFELTYALNNRQYGSRLFILPAVHHCSEDLFCIGMAHSVKDFSLKLHKEILINLYESWNAALLIVGEEASVCIAHNRYGVPVDLFQYICCGKHSSYENAWHDINGQNVDDMKIKILDALGSRQMSLVDLDC